LLQVAAFKRYVNRMNKNDFKVTVFSLSESLFPLVARLLGDKTNAEDAIQEIMIKLWEKRNQLENHPNIKGFVFLTARNYCLDILRKKRVLVNDGEFHLNLLKDTKEETQLENKELNEIIIEILKNIPKQQREVFIMRDLDGYDFIEIAAIMDIKITHTRVLVSRARKKIRVALQKTYSYERGNYE
jgi:RNA polymerase sigma-70 factor (ECF subfamily)